MARKTRKATAANAATKAKAKIPDELLEWATTASGDDIHRMELFVGAAAKAFREPLPEVSDSDSAQFTVVQQRSGYSLGKSYGPDGVIPPHAYVLAKDECEGMDYRGPDWAPFNLWQMANYWHEGRERECAKVLLGHPRSRNLWALIAQRYERPDSLATTIPMRCAEFQAHWIATPKLTPAEYLKERQTLQRYAKRLAHELEHFFDRHDSDYSGAPNFTLLLSEAEQDRMNLAIRLHNQGIGNRLLKSVGLRGRNWEDYNASAAAREDAGDTWNFFLNDPYDKYEEPVVPDLPELLRRIGDFLADDGKLAPLQRPKSDNAERNYFVRRLIRYFLNERGDMSPTIVAEITSMFFAQGISDNEVSKQANRRPDGRPGSWRMGETSTQD